MTLITASHINDLLRYTLIEMLQTIAQSEIKIEHFGNQIEIKVPGYKTFNIDKQEMLRNVNGRQVVELLRSRLERDVFKPERLFMPKKIAEWWILWYTAIDWSRVV